MPNCTYAFRPHKVWVHAAFWPKGPFDTLFGQGKRRFCDRNHGGGVPKEYWELKAKEQQAVAEVAAVTVDPPA
jgi:hypothetical protein